MAAVTVSGTGSGNTGTINYGGADPNRVRAFALDITVNNSRTITAVTCSNSSYYIYPGSISILAGSIENKGNCVCSATDFPGVTQPGLNSTGVTVEMGSLYTGGSKPASAGTLLTITPNSTPTTVTVAVNTARGGVVMENPDEASGASFPVTFVIGAVPDCLKNTATEYNAWTTWGKRDCWCYKRQCRGDGDNTRTGVFWVALSDLNLLRTAYNKNLTVFTQLMATHGGKPICADFDHAQAGVFRVALADLNLLRTAYNKMETVAKCCDADKNCTLDAGDKWSFWKP
jgi:hypothetical protein